MDCFNYSLYDHFNLNCLIFLDAIKKIIYKLIYKYINLLIQLE